MQELNSFPLHLIELMETRANWRVLSGGTESTPKFHRMRVLRLRCSTAAELERFSSNQ